jgi:hypothetical protein
MEDSDITPVPFTTRTLVDTCRFGPASSLTKTVTR